MDATEAATVLQAGKDAIENDDYQGAYDLVFPLHESQELSGTDQGDAAFVVGAACYGLGSMDPAHYYLTEASQTASADIQALAQQYLENIAQLDGAIDAPAGGITADEAATVIEAGNDALARGEYDAAREFFQQAYDTPGVDSSVSGPAAVGLARCYAYAGDLDTADDYAAFAEDAGAEEATELRKWIQEQRDAGTAASDGVTASELDQVRDAANELYGAGQYDQAYALMHTAYESDRVPAGLRGTYAYNLGMCCLHTQDYDAAHQFFTEAASTARPEVATLAQERLQELANRDEAFEIVQDELVEFTE